MKPEASRLPVVEESYLGRSYSEMDCQKFVETCLRQVGVTLDLPGSNAWYRKMTWVGTPEECVRLFGLVPDGAFLFWNRTGRSRRSTAGTGLATPPTSACARAAAVRVPFIPASRGAAWRKAPSRGRP